MLTGVEVEPGRRTTAAFTVTSSTAGGRGRPAAGGRRARAATSPDVGLETVGLDPTAGSVETDERMRAGERLWAVGDITGKGAFTHVSMYQARRRGRATSSARTARGPTTAPSAG